MLEFNTIIDIDTFRILHKLCEKIGIVDDSGKLCAEVVDNKIIEKKVDYYGNLREEVLYSEPFDVQYATTLINLYKQTCLYMNLNKGEIEGSNDYKTAYRLGLEDSKKPYTKRR